MYLTNYQFYEALNVVKLGNISGIHLKGWGDVVEAFMAIIKGHYDKGVTTLILICAALKRKN